MGLAAGSFPRRAAPLVGVGRKVCVAVAGAVYRYIPLQAVPAWVMPEHLAIRYYPSHGLFGTSLLACFLTSRRARSCG